MPECCLVSRSLGRNHSRNGIDSTQSVHWRYYGIGLDPSFSVLVGNLEEASRRWAGSTERAPPAGVPLSGQFAARLQKLYDQLLEDPTFQVDVLGSSEGTSLLTTDASQNRGRVPLTSQMDDKIPEDASTPVQRMTSIGIVPPPQPTASQVYNLDKTHITTSFATLGTSADRIGPSQHGIMNCTSPPDRSEAPFSVALEGLIGPDGLSSILQSLGDQDFMEMDRVISCAEINFNMI